MKVQGGITRILLLLACLGGGKVFADSPEAVVGCILRAIDLTIYGRNVHVNVVDGFTVKQGFGRVEDAFGPGEHTVFGIQENGHPYLVAGKGRYDGGILSPAIIHDGPRLLSTGAWFRFPNLPGETLDKLKAMIRERGGAPGGATCWAGACNTLRKAGIEVGAGGRASIPKTLERILTAGFVDNNGQPLPVEIYVTKAEFLPALAQEFESSKQLDRVGIYAVFGLVGTSAGGALVMTLIDGDGNTIVPTDTAPEAKPKPENEIKPPSGHRMDY